MFQADENRVIEQLMAVIRRAGTEGITVRMMLAKANGLRRIRADERDEILWRMEHLNGLIVSRVGERGTYYVAREYAKGEQ